MTGKRFRATRITKPPFASGGGVVMAKRQLIEPRPGDKRYVRPDEGGQFTKEIAIPCAQLSTTALRAASWRS